MKIFDGLVHDILRERWQTSPVTATLDGIHDYDDQLDIYDSSFRMDVVRRRKRFLHALDAVPDDELDLSRRIDKAVLKGALTASIDDIEIVQSWRRNPALYLQLGLYGLYFLLAREFAPADERANAAARRGEAFPRLLHEGKRNIIVAPMTHVETALQIAEGARRFLRETFHPFLAAHDGSRADSVTTTCMNALDDYLHHIRVHWLKHEPDEEFAIGNDAFQLKINSEHGLGYSPEQLLEMGEQGRRHTLRRIEEVARRIDPSVRWPALIERYQREHPTAGTLLESYRSEMARARSFVESHNLVTVPPDESLEIVPTPSFERPTTPYAAMMPPAPFDRGHQKGFFYVTPVEDGSDERLREHNRYAMTVTAIHEAYPGHHLQLTVANANPSPVRKLYRTPVTVEGWALYCEEMMHEQGYYPDLPTRLFQLKNLLWRSIRVILDVSLHTQGMKASEAVDFLVREAHLERSNAEAEVRRYCATPTQPMSYFIGLHEILSLRRELQMRISGGPPLRTFHDRFLAWGNIPIPLIREALFADPAFARAA